MAVKYYSIKGEGKYAVKEDEKPDENGMVKAIEIKGKKTNITKVKKSEITIWVSSVGVTRLRNT